MTDASDGSAPTAAAAVMAPRDQGTVPPISAEILQGCEAHRHSDRTMHLEGVCGARTGSVAMPSASPTSVMPSRGTAGTKSAHSSHAFRRSLGCLPGRFGKLQAYGPTPRFSRSATRPPPRQEPTYTQPMDPHRLAEQRSLAYHRVVAARMHADPQILERARARIGRWLDEGRSPFYAAEWERLLAGPVEALGALMVSDTEFARALRQSTPFAGVLTPRERWALWKEARKTHEAR